MSTFLFGIGITDFMLTAKIMKTESWIVKVMHSMNNVLVHLPPTAAVGVVWNNSTRHFVF